MQMSNAFVMTMQASELIITALDSVINSSTDQIRTSQSKKRWTWFLEPPVRFERQKSAVEINLPCEEVVIKFWIEGKKPQLIAFWMGAESSAAKRQLRQLIAAKRFPASAPLIILMSTIIVSLVAISGMSFSKCSARLFNALTELITVCLQSRYRPKWAIATATLRNSSFKSSSKANLVSDLLTQVTCSKISGWTRSCSLQTRSSKVKINVF